MSVVISINHETGDLTQYTSTVTDSGDLSVAAAAALAGTSYGLSCLIDDTTAIYGRKNLAANDTSGVVRTRFYIDPNSLTMAADNAFTVLYLYNGSSAEIAAVYLNYSSGYRLVASLWDDAGNPQYSGYCAITDAPHYVEIKLIRATNATSNDGALEFWVDGVAQTGVNSKDNYDRYVNFRFIFLGAAAGIDAGTSGTFYLDELVVNNDGGEIGPLPGPAVTRNAVHLSPLVGVIGANNKSAGQVHIVPLSGVIRL